VSRRLRTACGVAFAFGLHDAVSSAAHEGRFTGQDIEWESTLLLDHPHGVETEVMLAVPLPASAEVVGGEPRAAEAVRDETGAIVALEVPSSPRVTVRIRQPATFGDVSLAAPIVEGGAVQRVTLDGADFVPDEGLVLESHLRGRSQPGIDMRDRREVDGAIGGHRPRAHEGPMYLVADARLRDAGGLNGTLRAADHRSASVVLAIGGAFAGVLALCALAWKALGRFVESEAVEAYIRREFVRSVRDD
jgi:hypothetical protein